MLCCNGFECLQVILWKIILRCSVGINVVPKLMVDIDMAWNCTFSHGTRIVYKFTRMNEHLCDSDTPRACLKSIHKPIAHFYNNYVKPSRQKGMYCSWLEWLQNDEHYNIKSTCKRIWHTDDRPSKPMGFLQFFCGHIQLWRHSLATTQGTWHIGTHCLRQSCVLGQVR